MPLQQVAGTFVSTHVGLEAPQDRLGRNKGLAYRRANDMWHVKHLKGFTFVSETRRR